METAIISTIVGALAGFATSALLIRHKEKERELTERQLFVHHLQFETEFKLYKELWESLAKLLYSVRSLRPLFEFNTGEAEEQKKRRKMTDVSAAFNSYNPLVYCNRPFYAPEIFKYACELSGKAYEEWLEFGLLNPLTAGYYEKGFRNIMYIEKIADKICEAIRVRIWGER